MYRQWTFEIVSYINTWTLKFLWDLQKTWSSTRFSFMEYFFFFSDLMHTIVVSVDEDSYQSQSKMNWRVPEFDEHKRKPWAQAEKCEYSEYRIRRVSM